MINRIADTGKHEAEATAWQCVQIGQANLKSLIRHTGQRLRDEPNSRRRDAMLEPLFRLLRAEQELKGCGR